MRRHGISRAICAICGAILLSGTALAQETDETYVNQAEPRISVPLVVEGEERPVSVIDVDGKLFYRIRDVATALEGTQWAFDVTWDRRVYIVRGGTYTAAPLVPEADTAGYVSDPQIFIVDGAETTVNSLLLHQHYYLPVRCLNKVIGAQAAEEDGRLVFSAGEQAG